MAADLSQLPPPAERRLAVRVTPAAQRSLRQGHPWVFDQAIVSISAAGGPGDLAVIFDDHRRFLAIGLYDPESPLRVRVLQHGSPATIDRQWLKERVLAAAAMRAPLLARETDGYRLVHGENDGLPGLVVDRYAGTLVIKLYTLAWLPWLRTLLDVLQEACAAQYVVLRLSREVATNEAQLAGLRDGYALLGKPLAEPVEFRENGLRFAADVVKGQKTGFFLDQRENRARVERLARGRRTLNVFAYTGGFSVYAARGGAPAVVSVDLSAPALAAADANFGLNRSLREVAACKHTTIAGDAFEVLADLYRSAARFDLVVVDPPAFAKREAEVPRALRSYGRLTELALRVTRPKGIIVLASCSSRVSAQEFFRTVVETAAAAGRPLDIIERTGHGLDHPVRFAEGAYLKCVFAVAP
jgi:23S rRNA (cytosine1962-C5)-methyltransferase